MATRDDIVRALRAETDEWDTGAPEFVTVPARFLLDVMHLLEEDAPHVMDLTEAIPLMWVEDREEDRVAHCADADMFVDIQPNESAFFGFYDDAAAVFKNAEYGKTWRCWTSEPSEAQRKAEAWDD